MRRLSTAALIALATLAAGCTSPGDFICHADDQCGSDAFCEVNSRCSAFDADCASHRRYLQAAGDESDACVTAPCGANPILALASGGSASCVLRGNGDVTCWGRNDDGQLGDGTLTPRSAGVRVVGLTDAAAIAAGARHACAVRAGGTVVCWGADDTGQLGDGGGVGRLTPIAVPGITNATAVAAGAGFSCALLADRSAVCWGDDSSGQLGDGAPGTTPRGPTPVLGLAGARALAAQWQHACAVLTDGSVACWGSNASGQLGDGTTTNRAQPVAVPGLANVVAVATGLSHSCAMIAGGIRCWGDDSQGELGTSATTTPVTQPTLVPIVIDPVAIAAGAQQTCAVRLGGQVLCWGQNGSGQLGVGIMSSLPEPVPVTGLGNGALVSAGATFSCALTHDGAVFCWGDDHYGQLGTGHDVIRPLPTTVSVNASAVAAGGAHTCAVGRPTASGGANAFDCWGSDQAGQLGDNSNDDRSLPAQIKLPPLLPSAISAGAQHSCGIDSSAALWCWGRGSSGQLGPGHLVDTPLPIEVALPSGADQATAVTGGNAHTCALVAPVDGLGGEIFCFGDNSYGQLGDGTLTSRPTPALVSLGAAGVRAAAVTAGGGHSCAIDLDGGAWCWGRGDSGQLGDGAAANMPSPTPVALPGEAKVVSLSAGGAHSCAIDQAGGVWCWGADDRGQLGLGATGASVLQPTAVAGLPAGATGVAAGGAHSCASFADASVWCWGANDSGQLGDGTTVDRPLPAKVAGATGVVVAGALHSCVSSADGTVRCWGADTSGQLGDGVTLTISAPELAQLSCE